MAYFYIIFYKKPILVWNLKTNRDLIWQYHLVGIIHEYQICEYLRVFRERSSIFLLVVESSRVASKNTENDNLGKIPLFTPPQGAKIVKNSWKWPKIDINDFLQRKPSMTSLFFITFFESPTRPPFEKNFIPNFGVARQKCTNFFYKKICEKNRNSEYMGLWVSREYFHRSLNIFFFAYNDSLYGKFEKIELGSFFLMYFFYTKPIFFKNCKKCCFVRAAGCETATKNINSWLYLFLSPT